MVEEPLLDTINLSEFIECAVCEVDIGHSGKHITEDFPCRITIATATGKHSLEEVGPKHDLRDTGFGKCIKYLLSLVKDFLCHEGFPHAEF